MFAGSTFRDVCKSWQDSKSFDVAYKVFLKKAKAAGELSELSISLQFLKSAKDRFVKILKKYRRT